MRATPQSGVARIFFCGYFSVCAEQGKRLKHS
jgi:hypothetical protein